MWLCSAAESLPPPTLSSRRKDLEGANAIQVRGVTPLWMDVTPTERCAHHGTTPALAVGYPTLPTSNHQAISSRFMCSADGVWMVPKQCAPYRPCIWVTRGMYFVQGGFARLVVRSEWGLAVPARQASKGQLPVIASWESMMCEQSCPPSLIFCERQV